MREVYGEELTNRIMCWSHKDAAYKPKLKALKKASPILATKLEHDIHEIQWMVSSKQNFKDVYEMLKRKFSLGKHTAEEWPCLRPSSPTTSGSGPGLARGQLDRGGQPLLHREQQGGGEQDWSEDEGVHIQRETEHG